MPRELEWLAGSVEVIAIVDDRRVGETIHERPVITTAQWIDMARGAADVASVVLVESANAYDHFFRVATALRLPIVDLQQLERVLRSPGEAIEKPWNHLNLRFFDAAIASREAIERVVGLLEEPFSQLTLYSVANFRLTRHPAFLAAPCAGGAPAYRLEDRLRTDAELFGFFAYQLDRSFIQLGDDEILVDGGAFDGISLVQLTRATGNKFRRIDAYEPGPELAQKCRETITSLALLDPTLAERVRIHQAGLWSECTTLEFQPDFFANEAHRDAYWSPMGAHLVEAGITAERPPTTTKVPVTTIDLDSPDATYIKLEIEGSELRALEGARATLSRNRPRLSVAAYHKPVDLHELAEFLESLDAGYAFGMRHHNPTSFISTVLYAWPR